MNINFNLNHKYSEQTSNILSEKRSLKTTKRTMIKSLIPRVRVAINKITPTKFNPPT